MWWSISISVSCCHPQTCHLGTPVSASPVDWPDTALEAAVVAVTWSKWHTRVLDSRTFLLPRGRDCYGHLLASFKEPSTYKRGLSDFRRLPLWASDRVLQYIAKNIGTYCNKVLQSLQSGHVLPAHCLLRTQHRPPPTHSLRSTKKTANLDLCSWDTAVKQFNGSLPSSQTQGLIKKRSKTMKMKPIRKLKKATCGIPPRRAKTAIAATKRWFQGVSIRFLERGKISLWHLSALS